AFLLIVFFFQAEDGIRDRNVTGVQTCALPILAGVSDVVVSVPAGTVIVTHDRRELEDRIRDRISGLGYQVTGSEQIGVKTPPFRSEERRVGKERSDVWTTGP